MYTNFVMIDGVRNRVATLELLGRWWKNIELSQRPNLFSPALDRLFQCQSNHVFVKY
jgi:hypothetical protein